MSIDKGLLDYLGKIARRDGMTRHVFEKRLDFVNALNTEIGKALLQDLINRHEHILNRIAKVEATDAEKETYTYLNEMLTAWCARVADFHRTVQDYKNSLAQKAGQGKE